MFECEIATLFDGFEMSLQVAHNYFRINVNQYQYITY